MWHDLGFCFQAVKYNTFLFNEQASRMIEFIVELDTLALGVVKFTRLAKRLKCRILPFFQEPPFENNLATKDCCERNSCGVRNPFSIQSIRQSTQNKKLVLINEGKLGG